jgi:hypothetical protein
MYIFVLKVSICSFCRSISPPRPIASPLSLDNPSDIKPKNRKYQYNLIKKRGVVCLVYGV